MNNRLFLYSGLFLVLILLYDAWSNKNLDNSVVQDIIPETVVESVAPDSRSLLEPDIGSSDEGPATADSITVSTNCLLYTSPSPRD